MDYTNDQTFAVGDRVELHPADDAWMSGDRFATVESANPRSNVVIIRSDKSGRRRWKFRESLRRIG